MNASNDTYVFTGGERTAQPLGARLAAGFRRFRGALAQRQAMARQMQELQASTDRELWDMGLSRSDLREIARGTYRRD